MAFMAMFMATIFIIIVVLGIGSLILGIILNIICHVKKRKHGNVSKVLKIFAIVFTVLGILAGICPIAVVAIGKGVKEVHYNSEISDIPEDSLVKVDATIFDPVNSFDFKGKHYIKEEDLPGPGSYIDYGKESVGALVFNDGDHSRLAELNNELNKSILISEAGELYIEESEVKELHDYYYNSAPLYCSVSDESSDDNKQKTDSEHIRSIKSVLDAEKPLQDGEEIDYSSDGSLYFSTADDMYHFYIDYKETDEGLSLLTAYRYVIVSEDDAEYIRSLIK